VQRHRFGRAGVRVVGCAGGEIDQRLCNQAIRCGRALQTRPHARLATRLRHRGSRSLRGAVFARERDQRDAHLHCLVGMGPMEGGEGVARAFEAAQRALDLASLAEQRCKGPLVARPRQRTWFECAIERRQHGERIIDATDPAKRHGVRTTDLDFFDPAEPELAEGHQRELRRGDRGLEPAEVGELRGASRECAGNERRRCGGDGRPHRVIRRLKGGRGIVGMENLRGREQEVRTQRWTHLVHGAHQLGHTAVRVGVVRQAMGRADVGSRLLDLALHFAGAEQRDTVIGALAFARVG
jgi:hypothetical protein